MNRRDGVRVKDLDSMHVLMPYIKPNRCDSDVFINQKMDVTELVKYYERMKKKYSDLTYFHLFLTLIAKTVYNDFKKYVNNNIGKELEKSNDEENIELPPEMPAEE